MGGRNGSRPKPQQRSELARVHACGVSGRTADVAKGDHFMIFPSLEIGQEAG